MECAPTAKAAVVTVALPFVRDIVPKEEAPSVNAIFPVAVVPANELTLATNVTVCPNTVGVAEVARVVVVIAPALTICVSTTELLGCQLPFGL
jgi:hypothetical protein